MPGDNLWVIVPYWNCDPTPALLSILDGDLNPAGVVVVDDASSHGYNWVGFCDGFCVAMTKHTGGSWETAWRGENRGGLASLVTGMDTIKRLGARPDDIVCQLDGDDELLFGALYHVWDQYNRRPSALMSFGSYRLLSSTRAVYIADQWGGLVDQANPRFYRDHPWVFSHLKTWRVKLWDALPKDYLIDPKTGEYWRYAVDRATMLPMLELSGGRHMAIEEPIYLYNDQSPHNAFREFAEEEADCVRRVHAMAPLAPARERVWTA